MTDTKVERWGGGAGLASLACGIVGGALERGWPAASDPAAVSRFILEKRAEILGQSMLFVLSAGLFIVFLGSLRGVLARSEPEPAPLSAVVFGAGCVWSGLSMVAQSLQIGVAIQPEPIGSPVFLWTMGAMFGIANLPLAVMLGAVAVLSFRRWVFPRWLGWLAVLSACAQTLLWLGTIVRRGPLAPTGWLGFVLYPMFAIWLTPTAILMIRRRVHSRTD